ncbi:hypothetical protein [Nonomuraea jabiensis]|uniref:hypothetical protein n=1 Tax=Nonomuraea jabiensis TaxID=882448 RepID=UPI0036A3F67E
MAVLGAICFGLVIGWIPYGTPRRRQGAVGLAIGFFGYLVAATLVPDSKWLGD